MLKTEINLKKRPKAIIFDCDNTLVNSWPVIADALNYTLETFNYQPWPLNEVKSRVRHSLRDSFPKLFGDKWEDAAKLFYHRYGEMHTKLIKPMNGIKKMLTEINSLEIHVSVVSNKRGDFLRKEAFYLKWDIYFAKLVGANDAETDKPSIAPVKLALGVEINPKKETVWFIGDTDIDMECGWNSSCVPILLRKSQMLPNEYDSYPPAIHIRYCGDLCKWLRKLYL